MAEVTQQKIEEGIENNMLVSWFEARFGFLKPHYMTIAIVAGLLFLAAILFMFLQRTKSDNYASQWQEFNLSFCNTLFDGKADHLTDHAEQNPDSISSNWAMQIAGDITLREGLSELGTERESAIRKLKKAKANYQTIVDSNIKKTPMLEQRSVFGLAYAMESLGEFEEAGTYYAQLTELGEDSVFGKAATRGLARTKNPDLANFYADFESKKMGIAPGVRLATRPDIAFPEFTLPEGEATAGPQFLSGKDNTPEAPKQMDPPKTKPPVTETPATETPAEKPAESATEMETPKVEMETPKTEVERPESGVAPNSLRPEMKLPEVTEPNEAIEKAVESVEQIELKPSSEVVPELELEEVGGEGN